MEIMQGGLNPNDPDCQKYINPMQLILSQGNQDQQPKPLDPDNHEYMQIIILVIDFTLLAIGLVVFPITIVMMSKRKDFQPLKSMSMTLGVFSQVGNFLFFLCLIVGKILVNNYWPMWTDLQPERGGTNIPFKCYPVDQRVGITSTCYLNQIMVWLAAPVWYMPYFLRSLRMHQIWSYHERVVKKEKMTGRRLSSGSQQESGLRGSIFIQERNLIYIFLTFLAVLSVMIVASVYINKIALILPFFGMQQCPQFNNVQEQDNYTDVMNLQMLITIVKTAILNCMFMLAIYMLRNVDDDFNNKQELVSFLLCNIVISFMYTCCLLYVPDSLFVGMGFFLYFKVLLSAISLYLSGISPVIRSQKPNNIIPFPLNETTIASVESAIQQPISSKYFYNFLVRDLKNEQGISLFALYSDLRRYLIMCDDSSQNKQTGNPNSIQEAKEIKMLAYSIYKDYILESAFFQVPQTEIIQQLREQWDFRLGQLKNQVQFNELLFADLYLFTVGALEEFYDLFKKGSKYRHLQNEVEKQATLYNILRRYQLLSN